MNDEILGYLREARALCKDEEQSDGSVVCGQKIASIRIGKSRELALVVTKIDEAILWRQEDLRMKQPPINEVSLSKI